MRLFRRKRRQESGASTGDVEGSGVPTEPSAEGARAPAPEAGGPESPAGRSGVRGGLRATREALAPVEKKHIVVASFGLMGIMAGVIFFFSAASFWWTSQPSFCGRCHVMTPYIQAWERSPHKDVNCESCHLTPGFFGFIGGKIAGLQVVMNYIRGNYEDWSFNAAVSNVSCLQCHEEIMAKNLHDNESGITVSHLNIIEIGGKCMTCHSTVAHGEAVPVGAATHPTMATCLKCHNDETAPLDCDLCHTGKRQVAEMPPIDQAAAPSPGG